MEEISLCHSGADIPAQSVFHCRAMAELPDQLLTNLLKAVSRSFYLTLRVLPESVRPQMGLAYLLARTTDTVADTELIPEKQRLDSLHALRDRIMGCQSAPMNLGELARHQGSPAERILLERCEMSLELLLTLPAPEQQLIREVLDTIISGQEMDLRRFGRSFGIVSLPSEAELDDYTYRVAGCVGEFWTKLCRRNVFPRAALDDSFLLKTAVKFGKGLQLVNILRDLPADLRRGRCYLPGDQLAAGGLSGADLLRPETEPRLRPIYDVQLCRAASYLAAGWDYTNALPWRHARVRLACAWPILIGTRTIAGLRRANVLDPDQHVKITRRDVRRILARTVLLYPFRGAWRNLFSEPEGKAVAS
jgi:farnesyl-diphosphate farnesyltransferase